MPFFLPESGNPASQNWNELLMSTFPRLTVAPETTAWMTKPFVAATLLMGPLLGASVSVTLVLALVLGTLQYLNRNFKITDIRPQLLIFKLIVLWFLTEAAFGIAHFNGSRTALEIVENLPFLGYILLVSGLELSGKTDLRRLIHAASPITAFAALALAYYQVTHGASRAEGAAGNPGPFAVLCLVTYSFCLITALETKGWMRLVAIAGAGAAAASVIFSGTRGVWPCILFLPPVFAALYWKDVRMSSAREIAAVALILVAGLALTHKTIEKRLMRFDLEIERFQSGSKLNTSLKERTLIWQAGWSFLQEAPLAGHGLGINREIMRQRTSVAGGAAFGYSHFHNAILTQGVQSGAAGIIALLAMFFAPLALAWRGRFGEEGRHGLAVIMAVTLIYAASGATGIMFGHDLMDMGWISAIAYGSFMAFGKGVTTGAVRKREGDAETGSEVQNT